MKRVDIHNREAGQATIPLLAMLGIFLFAVLAFAVDLTNIWFHRQSTQSAADAACQAGAMDILALAQGNTPPSPGFTPGTAADCTTSASSSICKYAGFNGYTGASGFSSTSVSNSVSWTFPSSVAGTTAPGSSVSAYPFLKVTVEENIKTWFMALVGHKYQAVASSCTCGLSTVSTSLPIIILNPSSSGTLNYSGGASIYIYGGPQRSIQVDSTSTSAVDCTPSGIINTSNAGPSGTGGDLDVTGGPSTLSGSCYNGGTTGNYHASIASVADPYASVPAPTLPSTAVTATVEHVVSYGQDGCPDHSPTNYVSTVPHSGCIEFEPGYYPSGISEAANDVIILKPGIYYMNGNFSLGGSDEVRIATPCSPSCSAYSTTTGYQADGVVFYFLSGMMQISGGSGALSSSRVDSVASTSLTCNGTSPPSSVGVPSSINGNVLWAQCSLGGTYVGAGSSDTETTSGSRGLLIFMAHSNTQTGTTFSGSGELAYTGTLYYHATSNNDVFAVNGGSGTTTYALGEIVTDNMNISGSGAIKMSLSQATNNVTLRASILQ